MQAKIALRNVASAAAHILGLLMPPGADCYARANAITVRFGSSQSQKNPVAVIAVVLEQAGRIVAVVDQDLDRAIVVKVGRRHAVAVQGSHYPRSGLERDVAESSVVLVPVEQFALTKGVV